MRCFYLTIDVFPCQLTKGRLLRMTLNGRSGHMVDANSTPRVALFLPLPTIAQIFTIDTFHELLLSALLSFPKKVGTVSTVSMYFFSLTVRNTARRRQESY